MRIRGGHGDRGNCCNAGWVWLRANVAGLRETRFRFQRYFNCDFVTSPSGFQNPILSAEGQLRDRTTHRANRSKLMIYVKGLFEQLQPANVQTMKCDKAACYDSWTKRGSHALVAPCPHIVFLPFFSFCNRQQNGLWTNSGDDWRLGTREAVLLYLKRWD